MGNGLETIAVSRKKGADFYDLAKKIADLRDDGGEKVINDVSWTEKWETDKLIVGLKSGVDRVVVIGLLNAVEGLINLE